jgi:RND family efflux transporter MFP subunit
MTPHEPLDGMDSKNRNDSSGGDHHDGELSVESARALLAARTPAWIPVVAGTGLVLLAGGLFAAGFLPKSEAKAAVAERAERIAAAPRPVLTAVVRQASDTIVVRQPATLDADRRAQIFGQVGGYLAERRADVGDEVEAGALLGVIATPVLEKELVEAERDLDVARAELAANTQSLELARRTAQRLSEARESLAASKQEADDAATEVLRAESLVARATAAVAAVEARIARLRRQLEFRELRAPFAGIVTRRTREQGDYIEVGGNPTDPPIFTLLDVRSLRTVVDVPQSQAYLVEVGQSATIRVAGRSGPPLQGTITRISREIDPVTRTMSVQVQVPNEDGALLPGSFATVEIVAARPADARPALVPGNAPLMLPLQRDGSGGPTLAVVVARDDGFELEYRQVRLGKDFGNEVEILDGVAPGERIALNLPVPLPAKTRIEPVDPAPPPPPTGGSTPAPASPPPARSGS